MNRINLVVGVLVAISLSGCSGGSNIGMFLVTPEDVPGECIHASMSEWPAYYDTWGLTSNPGQVSADARLEIWPNSTAAMLAVLECEGHEHLTYSAAIDFGTPSAISDYLTGAACSGDHQAKVPRGTYLAEFNLNVGEGQAEVMAQVVDAVEQRTGGISLCSNLEGATN